MTYFNWAELVSVGRRDPAAIIILAYAQTTIYNESYAKNLLNKLNINHIPPFLFYAKTFTQYKSNLVCNYRTKEIQSYFKNPSFLFTNVSARQKMLYLRALSMRRVTEKVDHIPRNYFNKVAYNPFLDIKEDYIYFPQESSVSRASYTKEL
tara:strand:+ start:3045 stop:3497 length:453 start_codon:yes stop_codon:yes gene_type:complete